MQVTSVEKLAWSLNGPSRYSCLNNYGGEKFVT